MSTPRTSPAAKPSNVAATGPSASGANRASVKASGKTAGSAKCCATNGSGAAETRLRPCASACLLAFVTVQDRVMKVLVILLLIVSGLPGEGTQVRIGQPFGRSWSSVQKPKTPDSKFEIKTPSTTAVVRGTAFLPLVQQPPPGGTQPPYQVDDGPRQVTATAGGTV